jgi:23S rRNA (uracil1939-C5)-methyltransferase
MIDHPMVPCSALAETLTIEKLVYGGDGLARLDGKVIFTPYVLPAETVQANIERVKNDLWRGELIEVTSSSTSRVTPECPYFQRCGGCNYQHAGYAFQVDQKRSILREVLRRVGKIEFDGEIEAITGDPWKYRNRAQLHIENGAMGYFEHGSHTLCSIDHCPIVSPILNDAIAKVNSELPAFRWFTGTVELFTNETDVQVNVHDRIPPPIRPLFESLGTSGSIEYDGFRVGRNSFFQVNRFLIDRMVDCTVGGSLGDSALDLYAGVGLFSARLAKQFKQVTAIESSRGAFYDLQHNVPSVTAENKTTEEYLASLELKPDLILADPPRAGLGKQVVRELVRIHAPHLTIVSCDPATLARDLQGLLANGYAIEKVTLIDLFPQTFHLEAIVHLRVTTN